LTVSQWFGLRTVFFGFASKPVATVFSGLTSKLVVTVSSVLGSKPMASIFWFGPQKRQLCFDDLDIKITVTVS
jgi:hypothetical protein